MISMSWMWDKENIWVPEKVQTYDLPNTGQALYPLELRRTHGERGHILGSCCILHTLRISNVVRSFARCDVVLTVQWLIEIHMVFPQTQNSQGLETDMYTLICTEICCCTLYISLHRGCNLTLVSTVCEAALISLFRALNGLAVIYWLIMAPTQIQVLRWRPRTRISVLFYGWT